MKIKHITQSEWNSCLSACMAMLFGHDDDKKVWEEFGKDAWNNEEKRNYIQYMKDCGLTVNSRYFVCDSNSLLWGKLYLITVPSLNIVGGLHSIIADLRGDSCKIFDPARGRKGKKFYTWQEEVEGGFALNSFLIDCEIILD